MVGGWDCWTSHFPISAVVVVVIRPGSRSLPINVASDSTLERDGQPAAPTYVPRGVRVSRTRPVVAAASAWPPTHRSHSSIQALPAASAGTKATTTTTTDYALPPCGYPPVSGCAPVRHASRDPARSIRPIELLRPGFRPWLPTSLPWLFEKQNPLSFWAVGCREVDVRRRRRAGRSGPAVPRHLAVYKTQLPARSLPRSHTKLCSFRIGVIAADRYRSSAHTHPFCPLAWLSSRPRPAAALRHRRRRIGRSLLVVLPP
jgi:hypothetical protein